MSIIIVIVRRLVSSCCSCICPLWRRTLLLVLLPSFCSHQQKHLLLFLLNLTLVAALWRFLSPLLPLLLHLHHHHLISTVIAVISSSFSTSLLLLFFSLLLASSSCVLLLTSLFHSKTPGGGGGRRRRRRTSSSASGHSAGPPPSHTEEDRSSHRYNNRSHPPSTTHAHDAAFRSHHNIHPQPFFNRPYGGASQLQGVALVGEAAAVEQLDTITSSGYGDQLPPDYYYAAAAGSSRMMTPWEARQMRLPTSQPSPHAYGTAPVIDEEEMEKYNYMIIMPALPPSPAAATDPSGGTPHSLSVTSTTNFSLSPSTSLLSPNPHHTSHCPNSSGPDDIPALNLPALVSTSDPVGFDSTTSTVASSQWSSSTALPAADSDINTVATVHAVASKIISATSTSNSSSGTVRPRPRIDVENLPALSGSDDDDDGLQQQVVGESRGERQVQESGRRRSRGLEEEQAMCGDGSWPRNNKDRMTPTSRRQQRRRPGIRMRGHSEPPDIRRYSSSLPGSGRSNRRPSFVARGGLPQTPWNSGGDWTPRWSYKNMMPALCTPGRAPRQALPPISKGSGGSNNNNNNNNGNPVSPQQLGGGGVAMAIKGGGGGVAPFSNMKEAMMMMPTMSDEEQDRIFTHFIQSRKAQMKAENYHHSFSLIRDSKLRAAT